VGDTPLFKEVARLIKADAKEIIFTSGATESNNVAIKGVARFYKAKKSHIITTQTVPSPQACAHRACKLMYASCPGHRSTSVCSTRAVRSRARALPSRTCRSTPAA
jgi:hypothetical protein